MSSISVRNFKACVEADINFAPSRITILAGKNQQGKTSILQAMSAILSETEMPNGEAKTQAEALINYGAKEATVTLKDPAIDQVNDLAIVWKPKKAEIFNREGNHRKISDMSAGFVKFTDTKITERASLLLSLLKAQPTPDETATAIKTATGWNDEQCKDILQSLKTLGFGAVHTEEETKQKNLKSEWCKVTSNQRFADAKGEQWTPPAYDSKANIDVLKQQLASAETALTQTLSVEMANKQIDESKRTELAAKALEKESLAQQVNNLSKLCQEADEAVSTALLAVNAASAHLKGCPEPGQPEKTQPCPHCEHPIVNRNGTYLKPDPALINEETKSKMMAVRAMAKQDLLLADQALEAARANLAKQNSEHVSASANYRNAKDAAEQLEALPAPTKPQELPHNSDNVRQEIADLKERIRAAEVKAKADSLFAQATAQVKLVEVLAPTGIRQKKLALKLQEFNAELERICKLATWNVVKVSEDMSVSVTGGTVPGTKAGITAYAECSGAERFAADLVLQLAIAHLRKDQAICLDAADIFDRDGRSQLIGMLARTAQCAVIMSMTVNDDSEIAALQDRDLGWTYMVRAGKAALGGARKAVTA